MAREATTVLFTRSAATSLDHARVVQLPRRFTARAVPRERSAVLRAALASEVNHILSKGGVPLRLIAGPSWWCRCGLRSVSGMVAIFSSSFGPRLRRSDRRRVQGCEARHGDVRGSEGSVQRRVSPEGLGRFDRSPVGRCGEVEATHRRKRRACARSENTRAAASSETGRGATAPKWASGTRAIAVSDGWRPYRAGSASRRSRDLSGAFRGIDAGARCRRHDHSSSSVSKCPPRRAAHP